MECNIRIGNGFDVHEFAEQRALVLGGVKIPHSHGLAGHSDADCLLHALCDALFGAAGLGDIGIHFPDSNVAYKDISSLKLLKETTDIITRKGFGIINVDVTIICQEPRISPFIEKMKENISHVLQIGTDRVGIKATTTERLGFLGRKEGIAAIAVCLLRGQYEECKSY